MSTPSVMVPSPVADQSPLHFNREEIVIRLKNQLLKDLLVVLIGPHGSGKSVLADTNLSALFQPDGMDAPGDVIGRSDSTNWRIVRARPFADPIGNLARALAAPDALYAKGEKELDFARSVEQTLREDSYGLVKIYEEARLANVERFNLLLIVNQEQDFFRFRDFIPPGDDELFLKTILTAAHEALPIYVVFIIDSEELTHFSRFRGVPEVINNYRFEITQMNRADIEKELLTNSRLNLLDPADHMKNSFREAGELLERFQPGQEEVFAKALAKAPLLSRQKKLLHEYSADYTAAGNYIEQQAVVEKYRKALTKLFEEEKKELDEYQHELLKTYQRQLIEKQKDKYAFYKLMHFLPYAYAVWQQRNEREATLLPLPAFYGKCSEKGLFFILNWQLEQLYACLGTTEDERDYLQQVTRYLFQGLTESAGRDQAKRRAVKLGELVELCDRVDNKTVTQDTVIDIIRHFNGAVWGQDNAHTFITVSVGAHGSVSADAIVDISHQAILGTWELLRQWVSEESLYANLYLSTHAAAKKYLAEKKEELLYVYHRTDEVTTESSLKRWWKSFTRSFKKVPAEPTTGSPPAEDSLLYQGASLLGATEWRNQGHPNPSWAERYAIPPQRKLSSEERRLAARKLGVAQDDPKLDLKLVSWFIDESEKAERTKRKREKEKDKFEIIRLNRQRRLAFYLATAAAVCMVVATVAWQKSRIAKRNLELIDFVEVLNLNGILDFGPNANVANIEQLSVAIAKSKEIDTKEKVLDYLREREFLKISTDDPREPRLSYAALLTIDRLYDELSTGNGLQRVVNPTADRKGLSPSTRELLQLVDTIVGDATRQYPYVYFALLAQINALPNGSTSSADSGQVRPSLIESLASDPAVEAGYAYGDRNGNVTVVGSGRDPFNVDGPVTALAYGPTGRQLLIGHGAGKLSLYFPALDSVVSQNRNNLPPGELRQIIPIDTLHYLTYERSNSKLFHRLTIDTVRMTISKRIVQGLTPGNRISHTALSLNDGLLVVAEEDNTKIYRLEADATLADLLLTVRHAGTTINQTALRSDPIGRGDTWLFLGSETGDLWYTQELNQLFALGGTVDLSSSYFREISPKPHQSTITSLQFNDRFPQLTSASLDGTLRFWNLHRMQDPAQHIRLKNKGQGIWDMCYVNADEVVIAENINIQRWQTTLFSQREELLQLLKAEE